MNEYDEKKLSSIKTMQMILEDSKKEVEKDSDSSKMKGSIKRKLIAISEICSIMETKKGDYFYLIDESISYSINDLDKDENPFSGLSLEKLMTTINLVIALLKKWSKELEK